MGLIKAAKDAIGSMLADQWREYFYCDSLSNDILVVKGQKRVNSGRNSNKGSDNIISDGSIIAVNEGQCMIIVDQGQIVEFCADAGEFVYDNSTEPSLFSGELSETVMNTFKAVGKRFAFGGNTGKDQRVYYFNIKEIMSNLFGTAVPIPFRVVDANIGLDVDISIRCNGEYSFRICDPLLFYKNVCGNVSGRYERTQMASQLKAELMSAMQPAFARISAMGVRYSAVPAHTAELTDFLNQELSDKWKELRGIEIVSMTIRGMNASEEDEQMIKELQRTAVFRNPGMAAATLTTAQAEAMKAAASNTATGPMMAFANMNMAAQAGGVQAGTLYQMAGQSQPAPTAAQMGFMPAGQGAGQGGYSQTAGDVRTGGQAAAPVAGWTCGCGKTDNKGKFCMECGAKKPQDAGWTCSCGTVNQGKFCMECGAKKPAGAVAYRCDKCGWEPEDPIHPPKFCPECGDIFDDSDMK